MTANREDRTISVTDDDRRSLAHWAGECAERVLSLFEAAAPTDGRPREALRALGEFVISGKRTALLRSAAWSALAAARDVGNKPAAAAARAAGYAAATPYIHPLATKHQLKHVLSPVAQVAHARESSGGGDSEAAFEELRWAIERAPGSVRELVRQMPPRLRGRTRLDSYLFALDTGLRS